MKIKKNKKIRGFIREDIKGHYITNGKTPFEDGKKIFRLTDNLNGYEVEFKILHTFKRWTGLNKGKK